MTDHAKISAFIERTYQTESRTRGDAATRKAEAYTMLAGGCEFETIQWWYESSDTATFRAAKRLVDHSLLTRQPVTMGQIPDFVEEPSFTLSDEDFHEID
jgi:hypothetical protein